MHICQRVKTRLPTISTPNISARKISVQTFHQRDILAHAHFSPVGVLAHGHFVSMDISVQGHFGMELFGFLAPWTFRHSSTGVEMSVPKGLYYFARCQNIQVPNCSGAEIYRAETSMMPKKSWSQNILMPKRPCI